MSQLFDIIIKSYDKRLIFKCEKTLSDIAHDKKLRSALASELYECPSYVALIGHYADEHDFKSNKMLELYEEYLLEFVSNDIPTTDFCFKNKAAICLEKGEYIDFDTYPVSECWFPLALLCAVGNGKGQGDYISGPYLNRYIGSWQGYHIVIKDKSKFDLTRFENLDIVFGD